MNIDDLESTELDQSFRVFERSLFGVIAAKKAGIKIWLDLSFIKNPILTWTETHEMQRVSKSWIDDWFMTR